MSYSLEQIAGILKLQASVCPGPDILGVKPLEFAQSNDITYVENERFLPELSRSRAGAVIIASGLPEPDMPFIRSSKPEAEFARLTSIFYGYNKPKGVVSPLAVIPQSCELGSGVSIGAYSVLGENCRLGSGVNIGSGVVIGDNCSVGDDTVIEANVTLYWNVEIGRRVIIHSGTVIGSDGFGYAQGVNAQGAPEIIKKYHSGSVVIEDDVEIGALCAIDRALAGVTRIGRSAKIDNLVQIAHNVTVGPGTVLASQVGIAGSSSVGAYCMAGGQAGIRDHVKVGDRVVLATRVGVYRDVPDGAIMAGSVPAMPHKLFLRVQTLIKKLPDLLDRIRRLERLVIKDCKEKT